MYLGCYLSIQGIYVPVLLVKYTGDICTCAAIKYTGDVCTCAAN